MKSKMKKKYNKLIIVIGVITFVLLVFFLYASWPRLTGKKIILDTASYDPFDPIRGQYMRLFYEINTLNADGFSKGDRICVLLEEDENGIYRMKEISKDKFNDGVFICGVVKDAHNNNLRVEYGIEKFYFERGADVPSRNIQVEVAVSSNGEARVIQLLQDKKPVNIDYKAVSIVS